MESKRKANGASAADADDRASKRRKLAEFDLSKGETRESTTAYGFNFLEQIRRTADKSGRLVATYFEKLLPREGNEEYYKRTRMPVSLETAEEKLQKGEFQTLAELESYFKRMIANAKEFYPRSSPVYDDAERVRKALSNYMTKRNPAYGTRGYQAQPTPLPPEEDEEEEGEEEEGGEEAEDTKDDEAAKEPKSDEESKEAKGEKETKETEETEETEENKEAEKPQENQETKKTEGTEQTEEAEETEETKEAKETEEAEAAEAAEEAKGAEKVEETQEAEQGSGKDAKGEDEVQPEPKAQPGASDGGEEEVKKAVSRSSRRRSIVLKRRESGRLSKNSAAQPQASPPQPAPQPSPQPAPQPTPPTQPDHQYENVQYKDLTFQQAQEKIVEELLRYNEPEYEGYFEPFHNLPPRSLRDYYRVVSDPLSLKKLQKMVKGVHGRGDNSGTSDFKSWGAFEEKSKLLWTNAYYYNEEGSEIYELAQELEKAFYEQLKKAQAVVQEPSQPKIKLKVGQAAEAPSSSKKITIHVGGRGGSTDSATPHVAPPTNPPAAAVNGATRTSGRLEAARSVSASASLSALAPSPSPSTRGGLKTEDTVRISPAVATPTPVPVPAPAEAPGPARPPPLAIQPRPVEGTPLANGYTEPKRLRRAGKGVDDALISRLRVQVHPSMQAEHPNVLTLLPHPRELQQSATVSLPAQLHRVFVVLKLPDFLFNRQYSLWVLINAQPLKPCMHPLPNQLPQERAFEVALRPGVNAIEAHLIAAVPRSERRPGESEVELEVFTVFVNLMKP
ncbi:hypothetical protein CDD83_806 [Cordyceps sp. RAO-2017]|nr:hypothetical protein CDD83_806 [Cordyceps sp. RAO-2017]